MKKEDKDRLAENLGASRVVEVGTKRINGPLDLLALRAEFDRRLRSTGGRPTDPAWTVTRQVPFKQDSWARLQDLAGEIGATGKRVGPAQVAALLIEDRLEELEGEEWRATLTATRSMPLFAEPQAAQAAGVEHSQFDNWVQRGWVIPASRTGRQRRYSADEVIRARWLRSVAHTQADLDAVAPVVRSHDVGARYLVVTNGEIVATAATRVRLYRLLEAPGSHLVVDQLPERRKLLGLSSRPEKAPDQQRHRPAV